MAHFGASIWDTNLRLGTSQRGRKASEIAGISTRSSTLTALIHRDSSKLGSNRHSGTAAIDLRSAPSYTAKSPLTAPSKAQTDRATRCSVPRGGTTARRDYFVFCLTH